MRQRRGSAGIRPTNLALLAGFAVAVEPRGGLPRLTLVGQHSYWRLRSYAPAAARPAPYGARCPVLGSYGTRSPSLSTVVRGADTCLTCSPQPDPVGPLDDKRS